MGKFKHGHARGTGMSIEYRAWVAMKTRCFNPNTRYYHSYGGRGINVCKRWKNSFANFLKDMGPRPSARHSPDRINNNGNYTPKNCRWATREEQDNNIRRGWYLRYKGKILTQSQWARVSGIHKETLRKRLLTGWTLHQSLTRPIDKSKRNKKALALDIPG